MPEVHELKNGIRIVNKTLPQTSSVAIAFFVGAGGRDEDLAKNYGVTHFLEHLLFKGTKNRPSPKQISEEIDGVGGYINAYTTKEKTCFYVKLPRQHWMLGLEVLSDMIQNPLFDEREIDRERGVIIEEMNVYRDDPASLVFDLVGDLLWPNDTLRTNVIGTEDVISNIPRSNITKYYKDHYCHNNIVISVAGNLESWEIIDKVNEHFGGNRKPVKIVRKKTSDKISDKKLNIHEQDTNQSHFVLCARGVPYRHEDEINMIVLAALLGSGMSSRLNYIVREKKSLAYNVHATNVNHVDSGSFEIYAGVNKEKTAQALRAIMLELARVREQLVPDRELKKVKELIKGRYIMSQEENSNIADRMGWQTLLLGEIMSIDELNQKIDAVSPQSLRRVARTYLQPAKLRLAAIGPYTEKDEAQFEHILAS